MERIKEDENASWLTSYFLGRLMAASFVEKMESAYVRGKIDIPLVQEMERALERDWDPALVEWVEGFLEKKDINEHMRAVIAQSYQNAESRTMRNTDTDFNFQRAPEQQQNAVNKTPSEKPQLTQFTMDFTFKQ